MKNYSIKIFLLSLIFMSFDVAYASDFRVPDFNGISPQSHINKLYTEERKEALKRNEISYADIDDMIHLYNPEVLSMWNSWENNKSSNDIYEAYTDAADVLEGGSSDSDVADAMAKAQATGMRIQADKNYSDSYTNFLTNYMTEKNLVLSTKIMYFNFLKSENSFRNAEGNVKEAERKLNSVKVGYESGANTYVDLLTAEKNLSDAKSSYTMVVSNYNTAKRNLFINCGKSMNADATIKKEDINFLYDVANINFDSDYEKAVNNNFQYEIYKKGKENATTTEVRNEMDINLNIAKTKIYNDLQTKYNNIIDSVDTYWNYDMGKKLALDTYNQAKNSYEHGSISKNEFLSAEYALNVAEANFDGAIYDVNIAYITYKAAVDGLASC